MEELRKIANEITEDFNKLSEKDKHYIMTRATINKITKVDAERFTNTLIEVFMKNSIMVNPKLIEEKDNLDLNLLIKTNLHNAYMKSKKR